MSYHADNPNVYDSPQYAKNPEFAVGFNEMIPAAFLANVDDREAQDRGIIRRESSIWNIDLVQARTDLKKNLTDFIHSGQSSQPHLIVVSAGFDTAITDGIGLTYAKDVVSAERNLWSPQIYREIATVLKEVISENANTDMISILEGGYAEASLKCSAVYSYIGTFCNIEVPAERDPICLAALAIPSIRRASSNPAIKRRRPSLPAAAAVASPTSRQRISPPSFSSTTWRQAVQELIDRNSGRELSLAQIADIVNVYGVDIDRVLKFIRSPAAAAAAPVVVVESSPQQLLPPLIQSPPPVRRLLWNEINQDEQIEVAQQLLDRDEYSKWLAQYIHKRLSGNRAGF
jgi:hypothetical protein